jgi:hypothetical protein
MCIEVCIPFIEPRPTRIDRFIAIIIVFTIGVINVQAVRLVV